MKSGDNPGQPGPNKWLGVGVRLLVTILFLLLLLALNRCGTPTPQPGSPESSAAVGGETPPASARLEVKVQPAGARVVVDGLRSGTTPVTLDLPAGPHQVRVELDGYEPLEQAVDLPPGGEATVGGELVALAPTVTLIPIGGQDVEPTPTPTTAIGTAPARPDLMVARVQIDLNTAAPCMLPELALGLRVWIENGGTADAGPFAVEANGVQQPVEGLAAGQTVDLWFQGYTDNAENMVVVDVAAQVEESDEGNNRFAERVPIPTPLPPCTPPAAEPPTPTATPRPPAQAVTLSEGQVTIPTYPYAEFSTPARDERFNIDYAAFDRAAYEAANPAPRDVVYRTLVVENEYLKLTFLPDVGGRLYEVIYKPTGQRETYRNPVLKPSPWGPSQQGGWLAAGGIEWCFPVEEHGYEWGVPWKIVADSDGRSVRVTLRDTDAQDRPRVQIVVRLEAGAAFFTIQPRLENPTGAPVEVKYWTNAMLAPGAGNAPTADLRFVLPGAVTDVTVHSRGDDFLPDYNQRMSWPVYNGGPAEAPRSVDYSRLGNWNRWLGFFEDPAQGEFMAVYDEGRDEGLVRLFPPDVAQGAKVFAFGWSDPIAASNWTDDGSSYVEIHGGPAPTFDDSVTLPAGGSLTWTETWYPVAGLGGLRAANATAALNLALSKAEGLAAGGGLAHLAVAVPRAWSGDVVLLLDKQEIWRRSVALAPGQPLRESVPLGDNVPNSGRLALRLVAPDGSVAASYSAQFDLK
jgi:hypothetical protein